MKLRFVATCLVALVTAVEAVSILTRRQEVEASCLDVYGNVCSNRGMCIYGVCRCDEMAFGTVCQDTPTTPGWCRQLKHCVQCKAYGSGPLSAEQCYEQCSFDSASATYRLVDSLPDDGKVCLYRDEDDCLFRFAYTGGERYQDYVTVSMLSVKDC